MRSHFVNAVWNVREVSGLAGIKGAVHIGCQKDAEVLW